MSQDNIREKLSNFGKASYNYAMFSIISIVILVITAFIQMDSLSNSIITYGTFGLEFIFLIVIAVRAKNVADSLNDFGMRQFYVKFGFSLAFSLTSFILYPILNNLIWDYYMERYYNTTLSLTEFGIIYSPEMITDVILGISYILKYLAFVNLNAFIFRSAEFLSSQLAQLCSKEIVKLKRANFIFAIELIIGTLDILTISLGFGMIILTLADLILMLVGIIFEISGYFKLGKLLKGQGINLYTFPISHNRPQIFTQTPLYKPSSVEGVLKAKYCPKCGKTLPEDGTFCMSCGSEIFKDD